MGDVIRDVRSAIRQFRRRPLQTLSILLLMAVGIGGNAAAFQVFHALFLDPLPFPDGERLIDIDVTAPSWGLDYVHVAYPDFHAWRELNSTFESMALYDKRGGNMVGEGQPERVPMLIVSHGMEDVLGLSPLAGRFYTAEEDIDDGPPVGMISAGLWQRRFGNDPAAVGSSMTVNGFTFEVVGVLPPEAQYLDQADVWFPVQQGATSGESNYTYRAIGRLREGRFSRGRPCRSTDHSQEPAARDAHVGGHDAGARPGPGTLSGAGSDSGPNSRSSPSVEYFC